MAGDVRVADGVRTVKHTGNKDEAVAGIACLILPVPPDKVVRRISAPSHMGHDGANQNGNEDTGDDKEHARITDGR